MSYQRQQIKSVHFDQFKQSLPDMSGKTVVITGTTSGTGRVAAQTLAELGARLLLLNRSSERSTRALKELKLEHPKTAISGIECDLQSFASVQKAVDEIKAACPDGIDVLCNNAGVMALKDEATIDGFDVQVQTNHLSHFLLTCELMPLFEKAAGLRGEARIVNHSSMARMSPGKTLKPEYLEKRGGQLGGNGSSMFLGGARWVRYNQSKLANCAFTAALHERLQKRSSKVKALVAHPGLANTDLQVSTAKDGGMGNLFTSWFMRLGQSQQDGAMGIISCMCLPGVKSGTFYGPGKGMVAMKGKAEPFDLEPFYNNDKTRTLLWEKSCAAVGRQYDF